MKLIILSVIISLLLLEKYALSGFQGSFGDGDKWNECFCSGVTNECHGVHAGLDTLKIQLSEIRRWELDDSPIEAVEKEGFVFELPSTFFRRANNYGGTLVVTTKYPGSHDFGRTLPNIGLRIRSSEVNISFAFSSRIAHKNNNEWFVTYYIKLLDTEGYIFEKGHWRGVTKADVYRAIITADRIFVVCNQDGKKILGMEYPFLWVANKEISWTYKYKSVLMEVCDCPTGYTGDSCESCDSSQSQRPCENMEPCEDVCNDNGICLGCPECFETGSYHRNINNKTKSVFGACEFRNKDSK